MEIDLHVIKGPVRGAAPEANVFGGIKPPKNAYSGYKFISFTPHNNALHMLGKRATFGILGGAWPLCPLIPLMNSDTLPFLFFLFFFLSFSFPFSYIFPSFSFFSPFFLLSFSFLYFLSLRLEVRPLESSCRV